MKSLGLITALFFCQPAIGWSTENCPASFYGNADEFNLSIFQTKHAIVSQAFHDAKPRSWNPFRWQRILSFVRPQYPMVKKIARFLDQLKDLSISTARLQRISLDIAQRQSQYLNQIEFLIIKSIVDASQQKITSIQSTYDELFSSGISDGKFNIQHLTYKIDKISAAQDFDNVNTKEDEARLLLVNTINAARNRSGVSPRGITDYTDDELQLELSRISQELADNTKNHEAALMRMVMPMYKIYYRWTSTVPVDISQLSQRTNRSLAGIDDDQDFAVGTSVGEVDRTVTFKDIFLKHYDANPGQPASDFDENSVETIRTEGFQELIHASRELSNSEGFIYRTMLTQQEKLHQGIQMGDVSMLSRIIATTKFLLNELSIYVYKTKDDVIGQFANDDFDYFVLRTGTLRKRLESINLLAKIHQEYDVRKLKPAVLNLETNPSRGFLTELKNQMERDSKTKFWLITGAIATSAVLACYGACGFNNPHSSHKYEVDTEIVSPIAIDFDMSSIR